jgi:hypothetical protein
MYGKAGPFRGSRYVIGSTNKRGRSIGGLSTVSSIVSILVSLLLYPSNVRCCFLRHVTARITIRNAAFALRRLSREVRACHLLPTHLTHRPCFLFSLVHTFPFRFACVTVSHTWTIVTRTTLPHIEAESCVDLKRGVLNEQFLHVAVICLHRRVVPLCKADASNTAPHK